MDGRAYQSPLPPIGRPIECPEGSVRDQGFANLGHRSHRAGPGSGRSSQAAAPRTPIALAGIRSERNRPSRRIGWTGRPERSRPGGSPWGSPPSKFGQAPGQLHRAMDRGRGPRGQRRASNLRLVLARMGKKDLWRHFRPIQSVARWPQPNGVVDDIQRTAIFSLWHAVPKCSLFPSHNVRYAERSGAKGAEKLGFAPIARGKGGRFKGQAPFQRKRPSNPETDVVAPEVGVAPVAMAERMSSGLLFQEPPRNTRELQSRSSRHCRRSGRPGSSGASSPRPTPTRFRAYRKDPRGSLGRSPLRWSCQRSCRSWLARVWEDRAPPANGRRPRPAGIFPLGLREQTIRLAGLPAQPLDIGLGTVPRHVDHRPAGAAPIRVPLADLGRFSCESGRTLRTLLDNVRRRAVVRSALHVSEACSPPFRVQLLVARFPRTPSRTCPAE